MGVARLGLAALFGAAGLSKLVSEPLAANLHRAIEALGIRPIPAVVQIFATFELALASWLIAGVGVSLAASLAACALVVFSAALIVLSRRGFVGGCGCFLGETRQVGRSDVLRNLLLLSTAVLIAVWPSSNRCIASVLQIGERFVWPIAGMLILLLLAFSAFAAQVRRISASKRTQEVVNS